MHDITAYKRTVSSAPAAEPVSLAEAKLWGFFPSTGHDELIESLITAARQKIEADYDVALVTQTLDFTLDEFPKNGCAVQSVVYPLQSVASIQYTDEAGNAGTVFDSSNYVLEKPVNMPHRIRLAYSKEWASTRSDDPNAVTIQVVAGYGGASQVPETIKTAIKLQVKFWYDNPEDMQTQGNPWERTAKALLQNHFTWRIL